MMLDALDVNEYTQATERCSARWSPRRQQRGLGRLDGKWMIVCFGFIEISLTPSPVGIHCMFMLMERALAKYNGSVCRAGSLKSSQRYCA
jgi:hypothetical protein